MGYIYQKRPAAAHSAASPGAAPHSRTRPSLPNSALPGADMGGMGRVALRQAMREKMLNQFGLPHVDRRAEAEADRIGNRFSAASGVEDLKERMGRVLGADFSAVRFHTGAQASAMAAANHAYGFTTGRDIYLGGSGFDAATAAHEMVHTVQQGAVQAAAPVSSAPMGAVQYKPKPDFFMMFSNTKYKSQDQREEEKRQKEEEWRNSFAYKHVVEPHQKAVDDYNNHQDTYQQMDWFDRAAWAVQNPIAWLRGGGDSSKHDTKMRNLHEEYKDHTAARLAGEWEKPENRAALGDAARRTRVETGSTDISINDALNKATGDMGTGFAAAPLNTANDISKSRQAVKAGLRNEVPMGTFGTVVDKAAGGFSAVNNLTSGIGHAAEAAEAYKNGSGWTAAAKGVNAATDFGSTASDVLSLAGRDTGSGIVGIASNGIQTAASTASAIGNGISSSDLEKRAARYQRENGGLAGKSAGELTDEERYLRSRQRAVAQAADAADIRMVENIAGAASSGLKTAGAAASVAMAPGAGQVAGAAAGLTAAAVDAGAGFYTDSRRADLYRNTVNQEIDLDRRVAALRRGEYDHLLGRGAGRHMSDDEARQILLKSMGFSSGTDQEASNQISMNRATDIVERANLGYPEETAIMEDMNQTRSRNAENGRMEYSAQPVAEDMGYKPLPDADPFAAKAQKAQENREAFHRMSVAHQAKVDWENGNINPAVKASIETQNRIEQEARLKKMREAREAEERRKAEEKRQRDEEKRLRDEAKRREEERKRQEEEERLRRPGAERREVMKSCNRFF